MSTTAVTPAATPSAAPSATGGLIRANLRIHSWALSVWILFTLAAAGALLWTYTGTDSVQAALHGHECAAPTMDYCDTAWNLSRRYATALSFGQGVLQLTPVFAGVWAGAVLIGRELENGTAALTWTQSVSPARWLAAKLAVPAVLLAAGTTLLVLLHRLAWFAGADAGYYLGGGGLFDDTAYPGLGPVAVCQALFGLAAGALGGLLARRTLPGAGAGLVAVGVLVTATTHWRASLWPVKYGTQGLDSEGRLGAWQIGEGDITLTGRHVPYDAECHAMASETGTANCLTRHGLSHRMWTSYHPASHFWPLQLVESGVLLGVTALLVCASFLVLRRRTG